MEMSRVVLVVYGIYCLTTTSVHATPGIEIDDHVRYDDKDVLDDAPRAAGAELLGHVLRKSASNLWPCPIPYAYDASVPSVIPARVGKAIALLESRTNWKFAYRTTEADYIHFVAGSGCGSFLGRVGGAQNLTTADGCTVGDLVHQILRAIGVHFEHTRPDRDSYITVEYDNIQPGNHSRFAVRTDQYTTSPYDFESIMHWPLGEYGTFPNDALSVNDASYVEGVCQIGQRGKMTKYDVGAAMERWTGSQTCGYDRMAPAYRECDEPTVKLCGHDDWEYEYLMGLYTEAGMYNGRPYYQFSDFTTRFMFFQASAVGTWGIGWHIVNVLGNTAVYATGPGDYAHPGLVPEWRLPYRDSSDNLILQVSPTTSEMCGEVRSPNYEIYPTPGCPYFESFLPGHGQAEEVLFDVQTLHTPVTVRNLHFVPTRDRGEVSLEVYYFYGSYMDPYATSTLVASTTLYNIYEAQVKTVDLGLDLGLLLPAYSTTGLRIVFTSANDECMKVTESVYQEEGEVFWSDGVISLTAGRSQTNGYFSSPVLFNGRVCYEEAYPGCPVWTGYPDGLADRFYFDVVSKDKALRLSSLRFLAFRARANILLEVYSYEGSYLDGGVREFLVYHSIDDIVAGEFIDVPLYDSLLLDPHSTRGIALEIVSPADEVFQWSYLDSGSTLEEGDVFTSDDNLGVSVGSSYDTNGGYYPVKFNGGLCYEELPAACPLFVGPYGGQAEDLYFDVSAGAKSVGVTAVKFKASRARTNIVLEVYAYSGSFLNGGSRTLVATRSIDGIASGSLVDVPLDTYVNIYAYATRGFALEITSPSDAVLAFSYSPKEAAGEAHFTDGVISVSAGRANSEAYSSYDTVYDPVLFNGAICYTEYDIAPPIMRYDGYQLLMRHKDASYGFFSPEVRDTGIENVHNPEANTYSIIGAVDAESFLSYGAHPRYELELIYVYNDYATDVLRWSQESWVSDTDVVNADLSSISDSYGVGVRSGFHGLAKSSREQTYLDGSPPGVPNNDWWHAVASVQAHQGGIPGHEQKVAYRSELWIKKPEEPKCSDIYNFAAVGPYSSSPELCYEEDACGCSWYLETEYYDCEHFCTDNELQCQAAWQVTSGFDGCSGTRYPIDCAGEGDGGARYARVCQCIEHDPLPEVRTDGYYHIDSTSVITRWVPNAYSMEDCQEACLLEPECNVFTWRNGAHSSPNTCDLGRYAGEFIYDDNHESCGARKCRFCAPPDATPAPNTEPPTVAAVPNPTDAPTEPPTVAPAPTPTTAPTEVPTESPTDAPTTPPPSESPTDAPTTPPPSESPTDAPTTPPPSESPTDAPTTPPPSESPTDAPTTPPPSESPTDAPTTPPPSESPTDAPTTPPPSESPTEAPTESPTDHPTPPPPSESPTEAPTDAPTPTDGSTPPDYLEPYTLTYVSEPMQWAGAVEHCRNLNGDLPSIHSAAQEAQLRDYMFQNLASTYWVGYTNDNNIQSMRWSDGTPFGNDDFQPTWGTGDPQSGQCGAFTLNNQFWWDIFCGQMHPFACSV